MTTRQDNQETQIQTRKPRIDKGTTRLTQRDMVLLTWIGEQYVVRIDTLRMLISRTPDKRANKDVQNNGMVTERNVRRIIKRWQEAKLTRNCHSLTKE